MSLALNPLKRDGTHSEAGLWASPGPVAPPNEATGSGREVRIAGAIADVARAEAARLAGARLLSIGVNVGADCDIDVAILDDAFRVISQGTDIESVSIHFISRPRRNLCHHCNSEFSSRVAATACPKCASPVVELVGGDELEVAFIEVERS